MQWREPCQQDLTDTNFEHLTQVCLKFSVVNRESKLNLITFLIIKYKYHRYQYRHRLEQLLVIGLYIFYEMNVMNVLN